MTTVKSYIGNQIEWHMSVITAFGRREQEDHEFGATVVSMFHKKKKKSK